MEHPILALQIINKLFYISDNKQYNTDKFSVKSKLKIIENRSILRRNG